MGLFGGFFKKAFNKVTSPIRKVVNKVATGIQRKVIQPVEKLGDGLHHAVAKIEHQVSKAVAPVVNAISENTVKDINLVGDIGRTLVKDVTAVPHAIDQSIIDAAQFGTKVAHTAEDFGANLIQSAAQGGETALDFVGGIPSFVESNALPIALALGLVGFLVVSNADKIGSEVDRGIERVGRLRQAVGPLPSVVPLPI